MDCAPDLDGIHGAIGQLQRLTDLFEERRQQLARQVGLTEQQWRVLEEISTEHFMPSMFARRRESSAAAVSKILRQLADKDLIRVSIAKADKRQREYELSAAGERVMSSLRAHRQDAIEHIWLDLDPVGLEQFREFSSQLTERIERYAEQSQESV